MTHVELIQSFLYKASLDMQRLDTSQHEKFIEIFPQVMQLVASSTHEEFNEIVSNMIKVNNVIHERLKVSSPLYRMISDEISRMNNAENN